MMTAGKATASPSPLDRFGAYGLRIRGLDGAASWMQLLAPDAPLLVVKTESATPDRSPSRLDRDSADLALVGGARLRACRAEPTVRFSLPRIPADADLLHPHLAPAAALVWQWAGHEALHAGAVEIGGRAVLVLGTKEAGKSTTLAWLASELGLSVLADDLAVIVDERVLAGPRSIDLRGAGAGLDQASGVAVREGERIRITLGPAPLSTPVAGGILIDWGHRWDVVRMPARQRLELLASQRTYSALPADTRALLELASRPFFAVTRPRGLDGLKATASLLLDRFG